MQAPKSVEVVVKSEELLRLYRNSQVLWHGELGKSANVFKWQEGNF